MEPTLTRDDYTSDTVWQAEVAAIFHHGWFVAGHVSQFAPGTRRVVDVAGESVLLTMALDGEIHALANTCRHRGARLCETHVDSTQGSVMCPYHAWTYALDGRLIATPHLDEVELDQYPLWRFAVRVWNGIIFVSVASDPPDFDEWFSRYASDLAPYERYDIASLRTVHASECDITANWKIVIENYLECLHCTRVHPELVEIVPLYRSGNVVDPARSDGGVTLRGTNSFAPHTLDIPLVPGVGDDTDSYYGGVAFPNSFIDITGTSVILSILHPTGPGHTRMEMIYLFSPEAVATPGFDPSPVVEFSDLVAAQDNVVCERVQSGVGSIRFTHGVLSSKDKSVVDFLDTYRGAMSSS